MYRSKSIPTVIAVTLIALASHVQAQNASGSASSPSAASGSSASTFEANKPTLRVQLVISRFEGEKKLGSLPYSFIVTPNMPSMMHIRFGVEAPVPSPNFVPDSTGKPGIVQYRSLGTNIDCFNVRDLTGGRYQFDVNLQNSAALPGADPSKDSRPLFRQFDTSFTAVLKDGQSMQTIASTNPVTGEVIKIDVTLNVVR
jgi:hypothetical protein